MFSKRSLLRNGVLSFAAAITAIALSAVVIAGDEGFPLAFGDPGSVQSGSHVQSGSGVVKALLRLAREGDYTSEQADALAEIVGILIESGVPPGTILQVSKTLLASLTPVELIATLEDLGQRISNGEPPGQAANQILERGNASHGNAGNRSSGGNGNGATGDSNGGENGNGATGDGNGGGNGNGNTGDNNGGGNGNGNTGDSNGSGNGNGNTGDSNSGGNGNGSNGDSNGGGNGNGSNGGGSGNG